MDVDNGMAPACLVCRYDLGAVAAGSGACPECGTPFSKAALRARGEALTLLGLRLLAYGTLAMLAAEAVGRCVRLVMPAAQAVGGEGLWAIAELELLPACASAAGLALLGFLTGRTDAQRWWPGAVGALVATSVLYSVAQSGIGLREPYQSQPAWLQVFGWSTLNLWVFAAARGAFVLSGAAVLARLRRPEQGVVPGRIAWLAAAAGLAAVVLFVMTQWHQRYMQAPINPGVAAPAVPFHLSWAMTATLRFASTFALHAAWVLLAAAAFGVCVVRRSALEVRGEGRVT
jgi:hypothetical protein